MYLIKEKWAKKQEYQLPFEKQVHGYATSSLSSYLCGNLSETSECILGVKQDGVHTLHKAYVCGQNFTILWFIGYYKYHGLLSVSASTTDGTFLVNSCWFIS